jgi:hypothetical protein
MLLPSEQKKGTLQPIPPNVSTPNSVVMRAIELGNLGESDFVVDLVILSIMCDFSPY